MIQTPEFKGFQFENPERRPPRITDYVYSNDAGIEVMFLQKVGGCAPSISQSEVNRVIQSIHKISTQVVALKTNGNH